MQTAWLLFFENQLILKQESPGCYSIPVFDELPEWVPIKRGWVHPVGVLNTLPCQTAELLSEPITVSRPYVWMPLKSAMGLLPEWFELMARAIQILRWDNNHRYCGRCGQQTIFKSGTLERQCVTCELFFYPRISPSIIVMIRNKNKILLARKAGFNPGIYGLVAGFVEPGENLEQALCREVKEEVGITVKNMCYFGSQSWPFPDSLMIAFTADYHSGEITLNDGELEAAGWYDAHDFPGWPPSSVSIATDLIKTFIKKA